MSESEILTKGIAERFITVPSSEDLAYYKAIENDAAEALSK